MDASSTAFSILIFPVNFGNLKARPASFLILSFAALWIGLSVISDATTRLRVLRTSLVQAASGIPETSGCSADCVARSTDDAIAAGARFGLAGAIERILNEYRDRLGPGMKVLLTGNDASVVLSTLVQPVEEIPDLVLKGLAIIAEEVI